MVNRNFTREDFEDTLRINIDRMTEQLQESGIYNADIDKIGQSAFKYIEDLAEKLTVDKPSACGPVERLVAMLLLNTGLQGQREWKMREGKNEANPYYNLTQERRILYSCVKELNSLSVDDENKNIILGTLIKHLELFKYKDEDDKLDYENWLQYQLEMGKDGEHETSQ
jgi:hypothetical protein